LLLSPANDSFGGDDAHARGRRVAVVARAIADSAALYGHVRPGKISEPQYFQAVLVTNVAFLISNAYKRALEIKVTHAYKVAACHAAAMMVTRPLRLKPHQNPNDALLAMANIDCAQRLSFGKLGIDSADIDSTLLQRFHRATLAPLSFPSVNRYLEAFDVYLTSVKNIDFRLVPNTPELAFSQIEGLVRFDDYNAVSLSERELVSLENLINVYALLDLKYGNSIHRLLKD
jgi:hypothetical protein